MKSRFIAGLVVGLVIAFLLYLNFSWEGPSGALQFLEWKAEGSPSWIEWQYNEAME